MSRTATENQIRLIRTIMGEREMEGHQIERLENRLNDGLPIDLVNDTIAWLKARPLRGQLVAAVERPRPTEPGFYLVDQKVFKLVMSREGRLYAKQTTARGLEYVPGAMARIFADQKLSPAQIAEQGLEQGFCIVCSSEFEDPTSKHIGIGPTCGKNELGPEAYKALRASVADKPDVIAFEAAKKAAAKERREAKKREEAQLALV